MGKLPFMKFFPGDWIKDTRGLSCQARGAWIDILCYMWDANPRGRISNSLSVYSRKLGIPEDDVKRVFEEFNDQQVCLIETDGNKNVTLTSRRILRDEKSREQTRCRVERFRNAHNVTRKTESETRRSQKSEVRSQKSDKEKHTHSPSAQSLLKDKEQQAIEIYNLYPKKVGRPKAIQSILKALSKIGSKELADSVSAYATSCVGKDPQYIPHPATWFNQERWADQQVAAVPVDERELPIPIKKAPAALIDWAEGITDAADDDTGIITAEDLERDARECMGADSGEPSVGLGDDLGASGGDVSGGPRKNVGDQGPELPLST